MNNRVRIAALSGALMMCALTLIPHPMPAHASGASSLSGYSLSGYSARGVSQAARIAFTFDHSVFPQLLDVDAAFARTSMTSQAGGEATALAAQLYPGDLIFSQTGGSHAGTDAVPFDTTFPGTRQSRYPPSSSSESHMLPVPATAGPMEVHHGWNETTATGRSAASSAVAEHIVISLPSGPRVEVSSLHSASAITRSGKSIGQDAETETGRIRVRVSPRLSIEIASLDSLARAASDGVKGQTTTRFLLGGVTMIVDGVTYQARIDQSGLHANGVEGPVDLERNVQTLLGYAGVTVRTTTPVETVEGASSEASVGGLVVGLTGTSPGIAAPDAIAQLVAMAQDALPPQARNPVCLQRDVSHEIPLPLCISGNIIPGPGSGATATISIGSVIAGADASQQQQAQRLGDVADIKRPASASPDTPHLAGPGEDSLASQHAAQPRVVALQGTRVSNSSAGEPGIRSRLSASALLFAGLILCVLAISMLLGPSLRQWRSHRNH
ncbi:MAG: hypothetical protein NVSMB57_00990 [Actinomycetota bacterium]